MKKISILSLPMLHQWNEMGTVKQNLNGSHQNAKALVDIVTLLTSTVKMK